MNPKSHGRCPAKKTQKREETGRGAGERKVGTAAKEPRAETCLDPRANKASPQASLSLLAAGPGWDHSHRSHQFGDLCPEHPGNIVQFPIRPRDRGRSCRPVTHHVSVCTWWVLMSNVSGTCSALLAHFLRAGCAQPSARPPPVTTCFSPMALGTMVNWREPDADHDQGTLPYCLVPR